MDKKENLKSIPKVINYCWFGKNKKNKLIKKCIKSWEKYCPDYKIIEWNETNFDVNSNTYVKEAYEKGKWAFVTDYVRLYVLYNYGGIYLDTDVELISTLDSLLKYDAFFSLEFSEYIATGLGVGAQKGNYFIYKMLEDYKNIYFINKDGSLNLLPCPVRNTNSIIEVYKKINDKTQIHKYDNIVFLSPDFFCPFNPVTGVLKKTKNTLGIHWYAASWRDKNINIRRNILRPFKRIIGIENVEKVKVKLKGIIKTS